MVQIRLSLQLRIVGKFKLTLHWFISRAVFGLVSSVPHKQTDVPWYDCTSRMYYVLKTCFLTCDVTTLLSGRAAGSVRDIVVLVV